MLMESALFLDIARIYAKPNVSVADIAIRLCLLIRTGGHTDVVDLALGLKVSNAVVRVGKNWHCRFDGQWKPKEALAVGRALASPIRDLLNYAHAAVGTDDGPLKIFHAENHRVHSNLGKNGFLTAVLANLGSLDEFSRPEGFNANVDEVEQ